MTILFKMKPKASLVLVLVGASLLLIGVVLHIISMSTDYFALVTDEDAKNVLTNVTNRFSKENLAKLDLQLNYGLWRLCVGAVSMSKNQSTCYKLSTNGSQASDIITAPYWLQSAQALSIVGVILSGAGVVAAVAWLFTDLYRCVNLFLVASVTSAVIGGVLILSSDITFAAKYSIEFYHNRWSNDIYFTLPQTSTALPTPTPERMAYEIAAFDRVMGVAWSFALDIAAGSLCIVSALPLLLVSMAVIDRPDTNKTSSASDTRRLSVPENMEFVKVIEGEVKL